MAMDFWVIFDTCARAVYYRDVHNILALPNGATITYNYREVLLSEDAKRVADVWKRDAASNSVLLVYGQTKGFKHGDDFETAVNASSDPPVWIPTRLGLMVDVQVQNKRYYFTITLSDYPRIDPPAVSDLIRALGVDHPLVPRPGIGRWVSVSNRQELLATLAMQRGKPAEQWHEIVSAFQSDTQFSADSFWRLSNPVTVRGKQLIAPSDCDVDEFNVGLSYRVEHEKEISFDVENHEPRDGDGENLKPRLITAGSDSQSLRVNPTETELRPYGVRTMKVRARNEELFKESEYTMRLFTGEQADEWPVGAAFTCNFRVSKNLAQLLGGIAFGLAGAGAIYWATHFVVESSPLSCKWLRLVIFVVGVASLSASSYMLYRQLKFAVETG